MRPIKFLIPFVLVLLVCFQNCGFKISRIHQDISQSLVIPTGDGGDVIPRPMFPISWSTDTGNVKGHDRVTLENLEILADSICSLYSGQIQLERAICKDDLLANNIYYNKITDDGRIHNLQELYDLIGQGALLFDTQSGEQCLMDLDANVIDLLENEELNGDETREQIQQIQYSVLLNLIGSNSNCRATLNRPPAP